MSRISLLVTLVVAGGFVGCAQCDTCDDFPAPCVGPNCGQNMAYGPPALSPTMGMGPAAGPMAPMAPAVSDAAPEAPPIPSAPAMPDPSVPPAGSAPMPSSPPPPADPSRPGA